MRDKIRRKRQSFRRDTKTATKKTKIMMNRQSKKSNKKKERMI